MKNGLNIVLYCESLKKEKNFYGFDIHEYGQTKDKEALFVQRVEALISSENTKWIEIANSVEPKK